MKTGWEIVQIGDVCELLTGGTPSRTKQEHFSGGTIPWLVSGDVHRREIHDCEGRITELGMSNSSTRLLPLNSVIIALNGQGKTRGTVALLRVPATCNQSLVAINPRDHSRLNPEFLFWNLHGRYEEIRRITGDDGNDRRGLNMPLIRKIRIPVPPVDEQRRIVAMLAKAFAGIATATANAQKNLTNARGLFEDAAQEAFRKSAMTKPWSECTVAEAAAEQKGAIRTGPFGSQLLHSEFTDEGIAVLGIDNAVANDFRWDKLRFISPLKYKALARYRVYPGDVIITIMGTCGRCAVIPEDIPLAINTKHLCCITVDNKKCLPQFLHSYFLYHPIAQEYLGRTAKGSIMAGLNMGLIKEMPLFLPTIAEQERLIATLFELKGTINKLVENLENKLASLSELKQSLLQRAFAGELI